MYLFAAIVTVAAFAVAEMRLTAASAAGNADPVFGGRRSLQWRRMANGVVDSRPHYRLLAVGGAGVLPRRQWRKSRAGSHISEYMLDRRPPRHFFTTTPIPPVLGHWRALHDKLQVQTMWPGTARYPNEDALQATTVRYNRRSHYIAALKSPPRIL